MSSLRIVSLCPSTTATLFDLHLGSALVGRTKYCIHPEPAVNKVPVFGGTKNPDWDGIRAARPDYILFNKEENDIDHLHTAQEICKTIDLTPVDIESTIKTILAYGELFGVREIAQQYAQDIAQAQKDLDQAAARRGSFSYYYLIWHTPPMAAGSGTYIHSLLSAAGGRNGVPEDSGRYPQISIAHMEANPVDVVLLSSEPYPYKAKHLPAYKGCGRRVQIIDGELCSWHGSWTLRGLRYLADLEVPVG